MWSVQHLVAVGILCVEAGIFAFLSESWTVALFASLAGLLSLTTTFRFPLRESQRFIGALLLSVPFALQWAFAPYEPAHLRIFILYSLAHAGGQFGLALQACYLWIITPQERWSASYPVCGVCVLIAAGDIETTRWQSQVFELAILAFILLFTAYYSVERRKLPIHPARRLNGRMALLVMTLLLTTSVTVLGNRWLERSWVALERIYNEWMLRDSSMGGAGFSRHARLGDTNSQESSHDQLTVLRVYADEEPGYLRGAAFTHYESGNWRSESYRVRTRRAESAPAEIRDQAKHPLYALPARGHPGNATSSPIPSRWKRLEVWPVPSIGADAAFTRLETEWLGVAQRELDLDPHGIAYPNGSAPDSGTECFFRSEIATASPVALATTSGPSTLFPPGMNAADLLAVPSNLDPKIGQLDQQLLGSARTSAEKVRITSNWFRDNFHYELGMKVPAGQDPLNYFLTRRPAAHCEYFATGTVMLLRLGGVPCRYVTGFMVSEYNYFGGYWLARNKHAHAWVEAWLPEQGWVTVESTPPAGVPQGETSFQPGHMWDDLLLRVQMIRAQLAEGTLTGIWGVVQTLTTFLFLTPHGGLVLIGLLVWGVVLWRRHVTFTFWQKEDPITAEFRGLLAQIEQPLSRLGWTRSPTETIAQFADRLDQHSAPEVQAAIHWLNAYNRLRYQSDTIPRELRTLQAQLPEIVRQLRQWKRPSPNR